jgi:exonuclease III
MKLFSWNVRGLGGAEKRKEVRNLVAEKRPQILCLQETKMVLCDEIMCATLWSDSSFSFSYRPSVGASGGILTMWDTLEVEVWSSVSYAHVLQIHGRFIHTNEEFYLFNIYAPCDSREKHLLWASLSVKLQSLRGKNVCVCGDFNAIRNVDERRPLRWAPLLN